MRRAQIDAISYVVDLDKAPKDRWTDLGKNAIFANYKQDLTNYIGAYIPKAVLPLVSDITRGLRYSFYSDYADEMTGLAEALGITIGDTVLVNLIYQVEGLGSTCAARNTTGPCPPKTAGPGLCTGVVASGANGEVWQGRNLDWNLNADLLKYTLRVDYQRNGTTVFTGVQLAGMVGVLHGVRAGAFSVQMNARDKGGNVLENLGEVVLGVKTPTHVLRHAFETAGDFESAVNVLSSTHIVNPAYFIVAGAQDRQGAIVTRDRKGAIDTWHLFEKPAKDTKGINLQPDWLRLQTNYDHWEAVPDYDNRRGPGVTNAQTFCNGTADASCVKKVMTTWPTQNHHTDITSIMCPKTGYIDVTVWTPQSATVLV